MFLRVLLTSVLLTSSAFATDFERTLIVAPSSDIYVATSSGRIHIYPGSDSQVHIKAHVYSGWNTSGEVDDRISRIALSPPIQQTANELHIGDVNAENRHLYNNITIDYEISAPKGIALNLRSGSGDVEIDNLSRFLKAETGSGSIRAHGIGGPAELHTGSGDVDLEQSAPGEVKASTGSGTIRLHSLNGSVSARTGSGDIEADGRVAGESRLQSGSGSIRLHSGGSARFNVDASTGSGSIRIAGAPETEHHHVSAPINGGGPTLEVRTGSGDIQID